MESPSVIPIRQSGMGMASPFTGETALTTHHLLDSAHCPGCFPAINWPIFYCISVQAPSK